jgi:hypothetical protein
MVSRPTDVDGVDFGAHILVERLQRAGLSERQIVAAVQERTGKPDRARHGIAERLFGLARR